MSNPHDSYRGMGDSWPRIAPCRLLLYCEDHAYPYHVHYTDEAVPAEAWYPIGLAWFDYDLDYIARIPESTLNQIRAGAFRILFYYHEGDNPAREQTRLDQLCELHGLDPDSYRFVSGNTAAAVVDRFVYFADHELFYWRNGVVWNGRDMPGATAHLEPRGRRFTLLSRVHKWWRATAVSVLERAGLLDQAYWSYGLDDCGDLPNNNPIILDRFPGQRDYMAQFLAGAPYRCDDLTAEQHNQHWILADHLYSDSYASVVLETLFDAEQSGGAFITEKTFKAIRNAHPFVIVGCVGTLAQLRRMGYRTFDQVLDTGYDSIPDNTERFEAVISSIRALANLPDPAAWYASCVEDIRHNQQLFVSSKWSRLSQLDQDLTCKK